MTTYKRLPVSFLKGQGVWLSDKNKNQYLDALSGVAVNTLGHNHSRFVKVISEQIKKLIHVSNYYHIEEQSLLAKRISKLSNLSSVFFCNSGCEANEVAIKLARLHGHKLNIDQPNIIVMEKSFHGRTMATLSATGSRKVQAGFEPLMSGFIRVPFDDVDSVNVIAKKKNKVAAILVEPIQGEGGDNHFRDEFFVALRQLCDENEMLFIMDEVQTGIGITGKWWAHQHFSVKPDIISFGKKTQVCGLLAGPRVEEVENNVFSESSRINSTFGGNLADMVRFHIILEIMEKENLPENAKNMGDFLLGELGNLAEEFPAYVTNPRGLGLFAAFDLPSQTERDKVIGGLMKNKLLMLPSGDNAIRFRPHLNVTKEDLTTSLEIINATIKDTLN